jgi:putative CocE/NonD family hydrolase
VTLALIAAAAALSSSFGHYQPPVQYPETVSTSLYLPMRDGVALAVRIDRPAKGGKPVEGRFPVVWQHALTISPEAPRDGAPGLRNVPELTRYGYVVVQVARRGNGQSFGERRGYHDRNEAQDAYEVTQWLAAQPWSTGQVGIYGCSNTGDAAMQALTVRPPALKAAFAGCFSWHKYDAFRRGGIFAQWGTGPSRTVEEDMSQSPVDGDEAKLLLRRAAEQHQKSTNLFEMWKGMPFRDSFSPLVASRFWQEGSAANYADQIRRSGVALYILGGWYDELRDQGLITLLNVPGSRIVIGPWKHCLNGDFPLFEEIHRFFDQYLKGIETGIVGEPRVHYYTVNSPAGAEWRASADWPLKASSARVSYLAPKGLLAASPPGKTARATSFTVDYNVTCRDSGQGPFAQPCHLPGAGVSFAQPVLKRDTEVTGHAVADLWIAADAADANIFAYLEDVAPDGKVTVVTEGRLKASLRNTAAAPWAMPAGVPWRRAFAEDAQPLNAGEPVRLAFDLMPTSWLFKAGHRIQLTVTGADWRERARDMSGLARTVAILSDAAHPSSLTLPIVAAGGDR